LAIQAICLEDEGSPWRDGRSGQHLVCGSFPAGLGMLGRPVVVADFGNPAEKSEEIRDFLTGKILLRHFSEGIREDRFRMFEASLDAVLSKPGVGSSQVRGVVATEPQDRVAIIAVVLFKSFFPRDNSRIKLIDVRQIIELLMAVNSEYEKNEHRNDSPCPKNPFGNFVTHSNSPSR